MSSSSAGATDSKTILGKIPGTSSVVRIDFQSSIEAVDELIRPPEQPYYIAPGLIDLQVNGFAGVDYNDGSVSSDAISRSIRIMFKTGVTRFFPTIITGAEQSMLNAMRNLIKAKEEFLRNELPEGAAIEGLHIEGPHISPEDGPRGAHLLEHVRRPDMDEFDRWQEAARGNVRLVTVSPEWDETSGYVRHLVRNGVVASIGHTKANSAQIAAAVAAGASMSTHLGNAANPMLPKTSNYIWDQLAEDRLTASFIADGIHIPAPFLRSALRAKGFEHSVLVTDAVMPAMCDPGPYRLGQIEVELKGDGSVVKRGENRLAGSALRMDVAIGNCVRLGGATLRDAVTMATVNAARAGRIAGRQRGMSPGEKADLVRFSWDPNALSLTVEETVLGGMTVYNR